MNDNLKALGGLMIFLALFFLILTILFPDYKEPDNALKLILLLIISLMLFEKSLK